MVPFWHLPHFRTNQVSTTSGGVPVVSTVWTPRPNAVVPLTPSTVVPVPFNSARIDVSPAVGGGSVGYPHHVVTPFGTGTAICTGGPLCNHAHAVNKANAQFGAVSGRFG